MKKIDYSEYKTDPSMYDPILNDLKFWGIYKINNRVQIDVTRYKTACESVGIMDFVPDALVKQHNGKLFIPDKVHRDDYAVNIFDDMLNDFANDWNYEFKPIFDMIKKPKEVYDETRLNGLAYTSCVDDMEDIEFGALLSSIKRTEKYKQVIRSLNCQFISKLATEVERMILTVMYKLGYKGSKYKYNFFVEFSDKLCKGRSQIKIGSLEKYNAFNMLHRINNFLKHNTVSAYRELKRVYPANVASVENGTANIEYENGMYAGDWIIIKDNYIDDLLKKLRKFFRDYCQKIVNENLEEAKWNYDDYFLDAYKNLRSPAEYLGI